MRARIAYTRNFGTPTNSASKHIFLLTGFELVSLMSENLESDALAIEPPQHSLRLNCFVVAPDVAAAVRFFPVSLVDDS